MYLEELLLEFRKGAKIRRSNWPKERCIKIDTSGEFTVDNNNKLYTIYAQELLADNWELYQEPIDWDYIIKNKCLCCFWDNDEEESVLGLLSEINYVKQRIDNSSYPYLLRWIKTPMYARYYKHCRPVRRDEVTFYEEKENE